MSGGAPGDRPAKGETMTETRLNFLSMGIMHVALGLGVVTLPWLLKFEDAGNPATAMWATGALIAVLGVLMAANLSPVVAFVTLLAGVWAIAAPFVMDFTDLSPAVGAWLLIG